MSDIFDEVENELLLREIFGEDYNGLDIMQEGTVYTRANPKICLAVNSDTGGRLLYLPYFKITDGTNSRNGTKIARVTFKNHEYVIHNDHMLHWELNNKDIKLIDSILASKGRSKNTIYEDLIYEASRLYDIEYYKFIDKFNLELTPSIADIHYKNTIDMNRAKMKGIAK